MRQARPSTVYNWAAVGNEPRIDAPLNAHEGQRARDGRVSRTHTRGSVDNDAWLGESPVDNGGGRVRADEVELKVG